jgi:hypothetical protein
MAGPLHGYRIVDLTGMIAGPFATMILADQGADVIKVETQGKGDQTRAAGNKSGGLSSSFLNNNRNKRSITIDLKRPEGREALLRLAATADVFIQNFRPGVVERLGVDEDAVRAVSPSIVYVSISGFGETGPYVRKPTFDPIIQAVSGLATIQGGSDEARPRLVRTIVPDKTTALTAGADGRGTACPAVDARRRARLPVGVRHGRADLCRKAGERAARRQLYRPDLRDQRRLHERLGNVGRAVVGAGARRRQAGMARRPALQDDGTARPQHR